jgi:serine protease Do
VIAVGNPFGLGGTATAGIVSALSRPSEGPYVDYMQIDAPINRGNSGGPSFDMNGRVVGVNSAIYSPSGGSVGIGFDIPADVVQKVSRTLIDHGKVVRGYLGASIQGITPEVAESMGLKSKKGALVAQLTPGGPAAKAGLQTGDLVTKIDGHEVDSQNDLTRQVALVSPGQDMRLTVLRDGRVQEVTVKSGLRPSEEELARNDQGDQPQGRSRRFGR